MVAVGSCEDTVERDCTSPAEGTHRHTRALKLALGITIVFMLAEGVGGWIANSIALVADAGHMLGDAAALGLALFAARMAERPTTPAKTYGYLRLEILAALVNGVALFAISGLIVWRAVLRLGAPEPVNAALMLAVAVLGLAANIAAARVLHGPHEHSLNLRGAHLHMLSDALGSLGAIVAAIAIMIWGWAYADPAISIAIAVLILFGAWRLASESVDVLLEATPRHIQLDDVEREIGTIPGLSQVHDLHVWTVTSGMIAMTGHAVVADPSQCDQVLRTVETRMADLGIHHVTMQLEPERICADGSAV